MQKNKEGVLAISVVMSTEFYEIPEILSVLKL